MGGEGLVGHGERPVLEGDMEEQGLYDNHDDGLEEKGEGEAGIEPVEESARRFLVNGCTGETKQEWGPRRT